METIILNINDHDYTVNVQKNQTLLSVIRDTLDLTGTKCGCNTGDCGACKVIIDGEAVNSCVIIAGKVQGKKIETIEGVTKNPNELHIIQQSFIDAGAVQCGFCTPGMIISAKALLDKNNNPSLEEIKAAINNNICRCTGYVKIVEAILLASKRMRGESI